MTNQPLSEKILYQRCPNCEKASLGLVIPSEDVKQAIQKTLKELKDLHNPNSEIYWTEVMEEIDTTFKQNFGGLAE